MWTVDQNMAAVAGNILHELPKKQHKDGGITMTMRPGDYNLIAKVLHMVEMAELVRPTPAAPAPSYAQPGLLADEDGGPLFSMATN